MPVKKAKGSSQSSKFARGLLFAMLAIALVVMVIPASAFQADGPLTQEVDLVFGKTYDVSIGNGGIFIDDSKMRGTLFLRAEDWTRDRSWFQFTQKILDFQVNDLDGKPFLWVYGNVRIYFNLDSYQYQKWVDEESNMSIWYFDKLNGGWRKCHTFWEPAPGIDHGRLWCMVRYYTRYGLAWTQPTMLMKFIKLGLITLTPTPTPTRTPSPTP